MSMHIQPAGGDKVNITLRNEEIQNVTTYGKIEGAMAELIGVATKIRGDDNKDYYVNIRSLGKNWKQLQTTLSDEPKLTTDKKEGFAARTLNSIQNYFQTRKEKQLDGQTIIFNHIPSNEPQGKINIINSKVKTYLSSRDDNQKKEILEIISTLKMDKSNLNEVLTQLKTKTFEFDKDFEAINTETPVFDKKLNDFGKLQVLQTFGTHLAPLKEDRQKHIKFAVAGYFIKLRTMPQNQGDKDLAALNNYKTSLKELISEYESGPTGLEHTCEELTKEIKRFKERTSNDQNIEDFANAQHIEGFNDVLPMLETLSPSEKNVLIQEFKAALENNPIEQTPLNKKQLLARENEIAKMTNRGLDAYELSIAQKIGETSKNYFQQTSLAKEISELLYDQSNLNIIFTQLMNKIIGSSAQKTDLENFLVKATDAEKLQFIERLKKHVEGINPNFIKEAQFISYLEDKSSDLVPKTDKEKNIFSAIAICFEKFANTPGLPPDEVTNSLRRYFASTKEVISTESLERVAKSDDVDPGAPKFESTVPLLEPRIKFEPQSVDYQFDQIKNTLLSHNRSFTDLFNSIKDEVDKKKFISLVQKRVEFYDSHKDNKP